MSGPGADSNLATVTVVLPVRNAESEVSAALAHLMTSEYSGAVEVLVAVNGSADGTAHHARLMGPLIEERGWSLRVLEVEPAGKPNALRVAEAAAPPGPLVTCDVRVRPQPSALGSVLEALVRDELLLVSGTLRYQPGRSPIVNAFTRAYAVAPFARGDDIQGGLQAFAPLHRQVISGMPNVTADDRYFTLATPRTKRRREPTATVDYSFPDRWWKLLRQQVRWRRLNRAVDAQLPAADRLHHEDDDGPYFGPDAPSRIDIAVYWAVTLVAEAWSRLVPRRSAGW